MPLAGSFVVNIGELLELATNGYLRATVHRVVSPPAQQQRLSIAFFLGAQLDAVVPVYTLPPELAREARGPDSDPHNPLLRDVAGIISRASAFPSGRGGTLLSGRVSRTRRAIDRLTHN
ncbi:2-Oxobutyrate oxidase, putative [Klebsiella pneumoniae]|uniref:2-Oxobutyrate oxidase, putative n=1 Tax=Klebsiella pneumoniae TaxID=573 RepID=A0A377TSA3_KLEPN|nr:2-Oxobutyrate oxidase, putative [Klebsiella pneumoniae]